MNPLKKGLAVLGTVAVVGALTLLPAVTASAHVPNITADCSAGLVFHATDYDASKANVWSYTVGDVSDSGTFGASFDKTVTLPQDGKTTQVTAHLAAEDGSYTKDFSQPIGPCGTVPPITVGINPVTETPATCDASATYTVPEQPTGVKYALADPNDPNSARPVPGTFTLADGVSLTIVAHTIDGYKPLSYTKTVTGHAALKVQGGEAAVSCYPPVTCTVTGAPYSEDAAPVLTADGDVYTGQKSAVDKYWPVSGNLQGFTSQSVTFTNVAGYQPSITLVLRLNGSLPVAQGGSGNVVGYANLVAEAYQQTSAWTPGQSGTFTVTPASLFWTNKIANGDPAAYNPGSQANPQPLSFFISKFPANQFVPASFSGAIGPHLGSNLTGDTHATVTALSGCVNASTVPVKPEPQTRQTVITTDEVCTVAPEGGLIPGGGSTTTTVTNYETDYVFNSDSHQYVLGDEYVVGEPVVTVNPVAVDENCPEHVLPVDPSLTTVPCGVNQTVILPADTESIAYATTASDKTGATIEARALSTSIVIDAPEGWTANEDGTVSKTVVYATFVACITNTVLGGLATTGAATILGVPVGILALAMLLAILAGVALLVTRRMNRRNEA